MGTNYYARKEPCLSCGHLEQLHIGKSSGGWCFGLHVEPDVDGHPSTLAEWEALLAEPAWSVVDEYERSVTLAELLEVITERSSSVRGECRDGVLGPRGLLRNNIAPGYIGHGEGTWDLVTGDFDG